MKRLLPALLCLLALGSVAPFCAAESAGRNRVRIQDVPAYAVSLHTGAGMAGGRTTGEQWSITLSPVFAAEVILWRLLQASISVPFTIDTGYPYYGAVTLNAGLGAPALELGLVGGSEVVRYRCGIHFVPAGGNAAVAGASIHFAFIHDPVALKISGRIEITPDPYNHRLILRSGTGTLAGVAVLNEAVSVELGMGVDIHASRSNVALPPAVFGSAGIYHRRGGFTASLLSKRDLWNPFDPALIIAGIGWSKL